MSFPDARDLWYMDQALAQAKRAWGLTAPNPHVGAVIVKNDAIVAAAYHHRPGEPHAEINALAQAGEQAAGATLYVTLEPCSSFGRTPPCTTAILAAGVARVVIGTMDPNPAHAGRAREILTRAGVRVDCGVRERRCRELNKAFFKHITTGTPYVLLKMAMTLDGKIATAAGESQWITGPAARNRVQLLRRWADAIMIGGETLRRDRPGLIVRRPADWPKQPLKLICSRRLAMAEIRSYFPDDPTVRQVAPETPEAWREMLAMLGARDITALLIEGGGELAAAALTAGIVDEVEFHIAPLLLTGRGSRPVTGGADPTALAQALRLNSIRTRRCGGDLIVNGTVEHS